MPGSLQQTGCLVAVGAATKQHAPPSSVIAGTRNLTTFAENDGRSGSAHRNVDHWDAEHSVRSVVSYRGDHGATPAGVAAAAASASVSRDTGSSGAGRRYQSRIPTITENTTK